MADEERCPECHGHRGLPRMRFDQDPPTECEHPFHKEPPPTVVEFPGPSNPTVAPVASPQSKPVCPYCEKEQDRIAGGSVSLGPVMVMVIRCQHCRKILGMFQALGMQPVEMPPGPAN